MLMFIDGCCSLFLMAVGEFAKVPTELFGKWQEINQRWLGRISTEANLASEFASHLTSARSVPDAMTACHQGRDQDL